MSNQENKKNQQTSQTPNSISEDVKRKNNSSGDVTLSSAYLKKLEHQIQTALESSVKFSAEEIKKELQSAINDIAFQNHNLVEALKGFEEKLIDSFQSLAGNLHDNLSHSFNKTAQSVQEQNKELVSAVDKLENDVRDRFQGLLAQSLNSVGSELANIAGDFKKETQKAINEEIQKELDDFSQSMRTAQQQTAQSLANMYTELEGKKIEMEKEAMQEAKEYREKLISSIDKRVNEVVVGFLMENLGESLDINQQKDYIFAMLEENKEELKKDLHG